MGHAGFGDVGSEGGSVGVSLRNEGRAALSDQHSGLLKCRGQYEEVCLHNETMAGPSARVQGSCAAGESTRGCPCTQR